MSTLTAKVATTDGAVDAMSQDWERLRVSLEGSPFVGPTLYTAWRQELGRGRSPFVVSARDEHGELRAVAPWARRGAIVYSVPGHVKVAGELLCDPRDAAESWRAVLQAAFIVPSVLLVIVPHATDDLLGVAGATEAAAALRLPMRALPRFRRYRLQLADTTWEGHFARWSGKERKTLRYTRNGLSREGNLQFVEIDAAEGYDRLRELHMRQWAPERTFSWVHLDAGARIDKELIAVMPAKVLLLYLDTRLIAASLYVDSGRRRVFLYAARDGSIRRTTPGQLMHAEKVQRAFTDGIREIDLMGEGGHKERYALDEHIGYELLIGRGGLAGQAVIQVRLAQLQGRRLIARLRSLRARR